jgi:hypothetical protein
MCSCSWIYSTPAFYSNIFYCCWSEYRLSIKFNLEDKKVELNETIEQLDAIKCKTDYVVSCNGNFTEDEYNQLIAELC